MLWSAATPSPTTIPPNTPILSVVIPSISPYEFGAINPFDTRFSQDSSTVAPFPPIRSIVLIDVCIIIKEIAAANAATSFSFFAIPIATPIAKISGKLANTEFPAALITESIEYIIVPGPIIPIRL